MPSSPGRAASKPRISPQEEATRWGSPPETIRRLIASGTITGYRLNPRIICIDVGELDACYRAIPSAKVG